MYQVVSVEKALKKLDKKWDALFDYSSTWKGGAGGDSSEKIVLGFYCRRGSVKDGARFNVATRQRGHGKRQRSFEIDEKDGRFERENR